MLKQEQASREVHGVTPLDTRVEPHIRIINAALDEDDISPPHIRHLCSSAGAASYILFDMLRDHINKGRRPTAYLQPRGVDVRGHVIKTRQRETVKG